MAVLVIKLPWPELQTLPWGTIMRIAHHFDSHRLLAGGSELAETPAIVDVPLGRGHVVLFATNPMWRQETQGSFMLLLNAALNFDHLNAGRETPSAAKAKAEPAAKKP